jgi:hypothetical protein
MKAGRLGAPARLPVRLHPPPIPERLERRRLHAREFFLAALVAIGSQGVKLEDILKA